jgi:hypothetical protein
LFSTAGEGIAVSIQVATAEIRLLLLADSVKAIAPGAVARQLPKPVLAPLERAIEGQKVQLTVSLEVPGGVPLDEIEDLSEGHVLMLDQPLWSDWVVSGPSDVRLGRCRPGRIGEQFAIQLLSPSKP